MVFSLLFSPSFSSSAAFITPSSFLILLTLTIHSDIFISQAQSSSFTYGTSCSIPGQQTTFAADMTCRLWSSLCPSQPHPLLQHYQGYPALIHHPKPSSSNLINNGHDIDQRSASLFISWDCHLTHWFHHKIPTTLAALSILAECSARFTISSKSYAPWSETPSRYIKSEHQSESQPCQPLGQRNPRSGIHALLKSTRW